MEYSKDTRLKALLSYIWIVGIILFFVEKNDSYVRFNAAQSSVMVVGSVAMWILGFIPIFGQILGFVYWLAYVVFSIIAMVNCWNGQTFRIPGVSSLADSLVKSL